MKPKFRELVETKILSSIPLDERLPGGKRLSELKKRYRSFCAKTKFNLWHIYVWKFGVFFFRKFKQDRITGLAQMLAYNTSLSVIPLFIIFFSIFGSLSKEAEVQGQIFSFMSQFMVPESVSGVFVQLEKISQDAVKLGAVGFPSLFLIGIMLYMKMDDAINTIWRSSIRRKLQNNITSFVMSVFMGPVLLVLVSSLPAYLQAVPFAKELFETAGVEVLAKNILPFLIGTFIFYLLYLYVPITHVKPWAGVCGGMSASFMIWLNNFILGKYIENFTNYDLVYGSISILPIFLLWIFFLWLAILVGANMAYCAQHFTKSGGLFIGSGFSEQSMLNKVVAILVLLTHFFQHKNSSPSIDELESNLGIPANELESVLKKLINEDLIVMFESSNRKGNNEKRYQPALSPSKMKISTLKNIFHRPVEIGLDNEPLSDLMVDMQLHPFFNSEVTIQDIYDRPDSFLQVRKQLKTTYES